MAYFVQPGSSSSDLAGAINYILANLNTNFSPNFGTGIINSTNTTATATNGQTTAYLYRYLDIAYADNGSGSVNFSSTPLSTNSFYGLRNTNTNVYSTNPADYVWYQVNGTFSGGKVIWYQTFGGLQINLLVATSAPGTAYQQAPNGSPIDLTIVSTATGLQGRSAYAIASVTLASTPATYTTTGNATFPPPNSWGGSETWTANPASYNAGQNLWQIDGIYNPATNLTLWVAPYLATLKVGSLSAINANLGTITAGTLNAVTVNSSTINAGTTPPVIDSVNHTISSGAGGLINPNGTFAFGTTSANIVDDGSGVYLNGLVNANGSVSGQFTLGNTASPVIMTFSTSKIANTIISSSGNAGIEGSWTSGTPPLGVSFYLNFQLVVHGTTSVVQQYVVNILQSVVNTNNTSPYTCKTVFNYNFSNIVQNLPIGTYDLICNGPNSYNTSNTYFENNGTIITLTSYSIGLYCTSYYYQIG